MRGTIRVTAAFIVFALLSVGMHVVGAPERADAAGLDRITLSASSYSVDETAGTATIVVRRGNALTGVVLFPSTSTVRVTTGSGTATPGADYTPVSTTVTFTGTQSTATVAIPIVNDALLEGDETIPVALSNVTNAGLGSPSTATVTILSDDGPPELSVDGGVAVTEGTPIPFVFRLSAPAGVSASVRYRTVDALATAGTDYVARAGTVTFAPGTTQATVSVNTIDDAIPEPTEDLYLELSDPTHLILSEVQVPGRIADNDAPFDLTIADADPVLEGDLARFTVSLSRASTERVEADYATQDDEAIAPADYVATSGHLAIDPGQLSTTVTVRTIDDGAAEPTERFRVVLTKPVNARIARGTAVGTVMDRPPLPIIDLSDAAPVVEGGVSSFPITLSAPSATTVKVDYATVSGTARAGEDFVATSGTVTFAPGQTSTSITVASVNDDRREDEEQFTLQLSNPVQAKVGVDRARATIEDDDRCGQVSWPRDLNRVLNGLDPDGDLDGDGFTNGQELGPLAFDPIADPARFNPLVADVPELAFDFNGDLSIAVVDEADTTHQVGQVRAGENEVTTGRTDSRSTSVTDSHTVGVEVGISKKGIEAKATYQYSHSTTKEEGVSISAGQRQLNRSELSQVQSQGHSVKGGTIAMTVRVSNPGHVSYRIDNLGLLLRYRDVSGDLKAFDGFTPNFAFGQGPTLTPGQSKDIVFTLGGIGATDTLALLQDASSLVIGLGSGFELSQIGAGPFTVVPGVITPGSLNFARYQDTINQNTASVLLDFGDGLTQNYLVSTSYVRNDDGRPAGTSLCDALQVVLGRQMELAPGQYAIPGKGTVGIAPLESISTRPGGAPVAGSDGGDAYWITNVTPTTVPDPGAFGADQVLLRASTAAEIVLFRDQDGDTLDERLERLIGTSDQDSDTDGDGLGDNVEYRDGVMVRLARVGDPGGTTYRVRTDPTSADSDGDGLSDAVEAQQHDDLHLNSDPSSPDSDLDHVRDAVDRLPGLPTAFASYGFNANGILAGDPGPPITGFSGCPYSSRTDHVGLDGAIGPLGSGTDGLGNDCGVLLRPPAPELIGGRGFTVAGWVDLMPTPADSNPPTGEHRTTWLAGIPGFLAVGVAQDSVSGGGTSMRLFAQSAPCNGPGCAAGPTMPLMEIPIDAPLPGQQSWQFIAVTARPAVVNGRAGTMFGFLRSLGPDGGSYEVYTERFAQDFRLDNRSMCNVMIGTQSTACTGIAPISLDGAGGPPVPPDFTYHCVAAICRAPFTSVRPGFGGLDDLSLFSFPMTPAELTRVRDLGV